MTVDQPLKPKLLSALVLPNLTRSVGLPASAGVVVEAVTVTDSLVEPPDPVQVSVNAVVAIRLPVLCEPDIAFVPDHPPDAAHEVAFVEFHVSVEEEPGLMAIGFAAMLTIGAAAAGAVNPGDN